MLTWKTVYNRTTEEDSPNLAVEVGPVEGSRAYERLVWIDRGGMGEVWRVRDPVLGRTLAQKELLPSMAGPTNVQRFMAEAALTARLEHPAIVPIHDVGYLADGRPFFVMREVRGRTLHELLRRQEPGRVPRRLLDAVLRVAEALAYAHTLGVLHLDVKPMNITVGDFGEVILLDWGIARTMDDLAAELRAAQASARPSARSRAGTPGFMAPEQEAGDVAAIGSWSDVYALGATLITVLTGRPPPAARPEHVGEDLWELATKAVDANPARRPQDASAFARALSAWLDGDERRRRAEEKLAEARRMLASLAPLRVQVAALTRRASEVGGALRTWDPVDRKQEAWQLEDEAATLARRVELDEIEAVRLLGAALTDAPELDAPHRLLAGLYRVRHEEALAARDTGAALRWEAQLRAHDRGDHTAWLSGRGRLTVRVPEGATWRLSWLEERRRRLEPVPWAGPLATELDLPAGSWLVEVEAPDCAPVRLPVLVDRGAATPMLAREALGPEDVLVPAGWSWIGGTYARNALPRRRVWVDTFVMRRHPVTNREYIAFLDDLVHSGREEEALRLQPLREGAKQDIHLRAVYGRRPDGGFEPVVDPEGDIWDLDWPVFCVNWYGATAYAAWLAAKTGLPWRLPSEIEREKAGRGADGRLYPWGDHPEPTWTVNAQRRPGRALPERVQGCPTDRSVYGVEGLAGNARDWCLERREEDWVVDGRLIIPAAPDLGGDEVWRVTRGGAWSSGIAYGVLPQRLWAPQEFANALNGFRVAVSC